MRRLALVALLLLSVLAIVGCQPTLDTETGVVTSVTSTSLVDIDGFQLRTADGRLLTFSTKGLAYGQGFPPQHLREHQATGPAGRGDLPGRRRHQRGREAPGRAHALNDPRLDRRFRASIVSRLESWPTRSPVGDLVIAWGDA